MVCSPVAPTRNIAGLFAPLIGELIWQVRPGLGTFLTAEFGQPHLRIREPIVASHEATETGRRLLARRRVFVTGDWHLWIQSDAWKARTVNYVASTIDDNSPVNCLNELDGQRLIAANGDQENQLLVLQFDLGGTISVSPSTEPTDDEWSLHRWDAGITSCDSKGRLMFDEQGSPRQPSETDARPGDR